jgi:hypothetical protein
MITSNNTLPVSRGLFDTGGSGDSGFGLGELFGKIDSMFNIEFSTGDPLIDALLDPTGGMGFKIAQVFGKELNAELYRQWQLILEWHRISVPEDLWAAVDDEYAIRSITPYLSHIIAAGWFVAPLRPYVVPKLTSPEALLTYYTNARVFQGYWGAFGPLVAGVLSTVTVSPITIGNMTLLLPVYIVASLTSFAYFLTQVIYGILKVMEEYMRETTKAAMESVNKAFEELKENAKNIF